MLQTITQTPKPMQVQVCTNDSAFAVLEKAQHLVAECMLEQDPTAASYFAQIANIYRDLVQAYYAHAEEDLVPVSAITNAIVEHLVYTEDAGLFTELVADTDLSVLNVEDLVYLSN